MNSQFWLSPQVRDSGKITIIWRNLIHTELLQMTKESLNRQRPSALYIYVCIYSLFYMNIKAGVPKGFRVVYFSIKYKGFVKLSK